MKDINPSNLKILGNRVLVEAARPNETEPNAIVIPEMADRFNFDFRIVALGDGNAIRPSLKVGQRVLVAHHGFIEVKEGNGRFRIYAAEDIIAIVADGAAVSAEPVGSLE